MNSLERLQSNRLQRKRSFRLDAVLLLIFVVGTIPAFYPFVHYVDVDSYTLWIPLVLIAVVLVTHAALSLRTMMMATKTRLDDRNWEALAVTGLSAQRWVCSNWWAVFRETLAFHALFALLRLGIALMIAQLLHASAQGSCRQYGFGAFCYANDGLFYGSGAPHLYPSAFKFIIAGLVIIAFSLFEAGLLAALVVGFSIRFRQQMSIGVSIVTRCIIVVICLLIWVLLGNIRYGLSTSDRRMPRLDQAQIAVSTVADNGTLLAADLMRPSWDAVTMIRNVPSITLGLLLYAGLICGILWLAARQAMRRGMLPQTKRGLPTASPYNAASVRD